eukprot:TRINITY_DN62_c0_g1_i4.p1 TRINITY_DN62_c0_g1~~TRINITY_DN62_c0_g1_i4.p1  ORF type:complete len:243 (-),score=29.20 TRINITY_DN62_c0_g1_i4:318-1046(-)
MSSTHAPECQYRPLISVSEYEKQGREFTKQELQRAELYNKHLTSVTMQRMHDWYQRTDKRKLRMYLVGGAIALLAILLVFASATSSPSSDSGLVPMSFTQRIVHLPQEFVDLIRSLTGTSRKSITQGNANPPPGFYHKPAYYQQHYYQAPPITDPENATAELEAIMARYPSYYDRRDDDYNAQEERSYHYSADPEQHVAADQNAIETPTSVFGSYLPKNVNIFAFAYSTAKGWASSLCSFLW